MLTYVSLIVCLSGAPRQCQTIMPSTAPVTSPAACLITGQQTAALWIDHHPGWRLARVRCTPGNPPPPEQST